MDQDVRDDQRRAVGYKRGEEKMVVMMRSMSHFNDLVKDGETDGHFRGAIVAHALGVLENKFLRRAFVCRAFLRLLLPPTCSRLLAVRF